MPKHAVLPLSQTFAGTNTFDGTIIAGNQSVSIAGKGDNVEHSGFIIFDDVTGNGDGGTINLSGGMAVSGNGGGVDFTGGDASTGSEGNGGDINLYGGTPDGAGLAGKINLNAETIIGSGLNYTKFDTSGHQTLIGDATTFDDIVFELTETRRGASTKPDWDATNLGFLFPQNDPTEIINITNQIPHKWKVG